MGATYTRQSSSNITDGAVIEASPRQYYLGGSAEGGGTKSRCS